MIKDNDGQPRSRRTATKVVTAGRDPASYHGFVNPPVYHASTVLYPNAEDFVAHRARYQYGRRGTPTTEALEFALQELEGPQCAGVSLLPSGLAAISAALLGGRACRRPYPRHRQRLSADAQFLRAVAARGSASPRPITIRCIGAAIATLFKPNTRAVYLELPGSLSFRNAGRRRPSPKPRMPKARSC